MSDKHTPEDIATRLLNTAAGDETDIDRAIRLAQAERLSGLSSADIEVLEQKRVKDLADALAAKRAAAKARQAEIERWEEQRTAKDAARDRVRARVSAAGKVSVETFKLRSVPKITVLNAVARKVEPAPILTSEQIATLAAYADVSPADVATAIDAIQRTIADAPRPLLSIDETRWIGKELDTDPVFVREVEAAVLAQIMGAFSEPYFDDAEAEASLAA